MAPQYYPIVEKLALYMTVVSCVVMICLSIMHGLTLRYGGEKAAESVGKFYNSLLGLNGLKLTAIVFSIIAVVILNLTSRLSEGSTVAIISGTLGYLFGNRNSFKSENGELTTTPVEKPSGYK